MVTRRQSANTWAERQRLWQQRVHPARWHRVVPRRQSCSYMEHASAFVAAHAGSSGHDPSAGIVWCSAVSMQPDRSDLHAQRFMPQYIARLRRQQELDDPVQGSAPALLRPSTAIAMLAKLAQVADHEACRRKVTAHLRHSVGRCAGRARSHSQAACQSSGRSRRCAYCSASIVADVTSSGQLAPTAAQVLHTDGSAHLHSP